MEETWGFSSTDSYKTEMMLEEWQSP
jgi:hypothetical protein